MLPNTPILLFPDNVEVIATRETTSGFEWKPERRIFVWVFLKSFFFAKVTGWLVEQDQKLFFYLSSHDEGQVQHSRVVAV